MTRAWYYLDESLDEPDVLTTPLGEVVVHTRESPARGRPNEDSAGVVALDRGLILLVADGVGGAPGGQTASRRAIERLADHGLKNSGPESLREIVLAGLELSNQEILSLGNGSATTIVCANLQPSESGGVLFRSLHVGDSVALVTGQRGRVKHQSISHSPVGYLVEAGVLDEDDAMTHEDRHIVSNLVGSQKMSIDIGPKFELAPHDTVLIASDGVTDNLYSDEIVEIIRKGPLSKAAKELARQTQERMVGGVDPSKPDDATFVLFRAGK